MRIALLLLAVFSVSGCYSIGNIDITDTRITAKIVSGETTRDQVEEILGKPTWVCFDGGNEAEWHYCYTMTTLSFRQLIPVLGWFFGGPDTELHTFTLRFDDNVVGTVATGEERSKDGFQGAGVKRVIRANASAKPRPTFRRRKLRGAAS